MNSTDGTIEVDTSEWYAAFDFEHVSAQQSMHDDDSGWSFASAPSHFDVEMCGQDPRAAGLGPAQASHDQPRPTSSEDANPLRQHDAASLLLGDALDNSYPAPYGHRFSRMYCATPRRRLLPEKQARR
jgi:hypothetical protein